MAPRRRNLAAIVQSEMRAASMVSEPMLLGSTLEDDDVQAWLPMVHNEETLVEPVDSWALIGDVRMVDQPPPPPPWRRREARSDQELDMGSKLRYPCHSPSVRRNYRPPKSAGSNGFRSTAGSFDHVKLTQLRSCEGFSDLDAELSSVSRRYRPPHARQSVSSILPPSCRYQPPHARESVSSSPHLSSWKDGSNLDLEIYSARWFRRSTPTVRRNASPIPSLSINRIHQMEGNLESPLSRTRPRTRGDELEEDTGPVPSPRHHQIDPQIGVDWYIQSKARCTPTVRRNACETTELQKTDSVPKLHNTEPEQVKKSIDSPLSCFDSGPIWDEDEHSHEISSLHYDHGSRRNDDNGQNGLGSTFRVLLCVGEEIVRKDLKAEHEQLRCNKIIKEMGLACTEYATGGCGEHSEVGSLKASSAIKGASTVALISLTEEVAQASSSFPTSRIDLQGSLRDSMKDPAMRALFTSMMKNVSPEMMANMLELYGLKFSKEDATKVQQTMLLIETLIVPVVAKMSVLKWLIAGHFIFDPGGDLIAVGLWMLSPGIGGNSFFILSCVSREYANHCQHPQGEVFRVRSSP